MNIKRIFSVASVIGLSASLWIGNYVSMAQSSDAVLTSQLSARFIGFVPPADEGAPRHTRGGATRDDCNALQVLPESASGLTVSAQPTLVAYFKEDVQQVFLQVDAVDGSESYTYTDDEFFDIESAGFAELPMPESLSELTPNKEYDWMMLLSCKNKPWGPNSTVVKGSIKRVPSVLPPSTDIASMSWDEKARLYAESGLWYDLVSTLMAEKLQSPGNADIEQAWDSVWTSVGLDDAFEQFTVEE